MAYATEQDIADRIGSESLLDIAGTEADSTVLDSAAVANAIEDAEGLIDGYVGSRYPVPVSPAPAVLVRLSIDMAIYNLATVAGELTEDRENRQKASLKVLTDISRGLISLGAQTPVESKQGAAVISSSARIFGRGAMSGF